MEKYRIVDLNTKQIMGAKWCKKNHSDTTNSCQNRKGKYFILEISAKYIYDDIFNDFGCMPGEHTCTITANHNCNI